MTLLDKYLAGHSEAVYDQIYSLGAGAFEPEEFKEIDEVLNETFKRAQFNLTTIYEKLRTVDYKFLADTYEDPYDKPLVLPNDHYEDLINELERKVTPYYIPVSLKYFYKYIGACDFTWDWKRKPDIPWEGADPIVIPSINYLVEGLEEGSYQDELALCPDNLQKDNVSGDSYYLELGSSPIIDSVISGYNLKFIEYLRLTFLNCGFSAANECDSKSLREFCQDIKRRLLPV